MNVPVGYVEALVGDLQEINRQKDVEIEDLEQQKEADVAEIAALRAELDFHQNIADKLLKVNEDMKEISKKKVFKMDDTMNLLRLGTRVHLIIQNKEELIDKYKAMLENNQNHKNTLRETIQLYKNLIHRLLEIAAKDLETSQEQKGVINKAFEELESTKSFAQDNDLGNKSEESSSSDTQVVVTPKAAPIPNIGNSGMNSVRRSSRLNRKVIESSSEIKKAKHVRSI
eukprot:NP_510501.1 Uncharacterized protein CELE_H03G16.5 [Caenorhabditis elegans]